MTMMASEPAGLQMGWPSLIRGTVSELQQRREDVEQWRSGALERHEILAEQVRQWNDGDAQRDILYEYRELKHKLSRSKRVLAVLDKELARRSS